MQLVSVAFELGKEMLFVNSKLPCNGCTQTHLKIVLQSSSYIIITLRRDRALKHGLIFGPFKGAGPNNYIITDDPLMSLKNH